MTEKDKYVTLCGVFANALGKDTMLLFSSFMLRIPLQHVEDHSSPKLPIFRDSKQC